MNMAFVMLNCLIVVFAVFWLFLIIIFEHKNCDRQENCMLRGWIAKKEIILILARIILREFLFKGNNEIMLVFVVDIFLLVSWTLTMITSYCKDMNEEMVNE